MDQGLPPQTGNVTSDDRLWAMLSWVVAPLVSAIMLFIDKKNRPFIKYNAVNATAYGLLNMAITIVIGIIPVVQCVAPLVSFAIWAYGAYMGYQSYQGQTVTVPVVTDFVKQQGWLN